MWGMIKKAINSDLSEPLNDKLGLVNSDGKKYVPVVSSYFKTMTLLNLANFSSVHIAQDDDYIYACHSTFVRKIDKISMTVVAEYDYGDTTNLVAVDENFVYLTGQTQNNVVKIDKNTFTLIASSSSYTFSLNILDLDEDYLYISDSSILRLLNKSNLTEHSSVSPGIGSLTSIDASDITYVYVSGGTGGVIQKRLKSDLSLTLTAPTNFGATVNSIIQDEEYLYVGGGKQQIWKLDKTTLVKISEGTYVRLQVFSLAQDEDYIYATGTLSSSNAPLNVFYKKQMNMIKSLSFTDESKKLLIDNGLIYRAGNGVRKINNYSEVLGYEEV